MVSSNSSVVNCEVRKVLLRSRLFLWARLLGPETHAVLGTDAVYVVVGTCGDRIQYWAAAVPRRRAAREVRQVFGFGVENKSHGLEACARAT